MTLSLPLWLPRTIDESARPRHWPDGQFSTFRPRLCTIHQAVELVAFLTIWLLFGSALTFSAIGMPAIYYRSAITLAGLELAALWMDSFGPFPALGHLLAAVEVPLLGVALLSVVIMRAWRSTRIAGEDPRHRRPRQGRRGDGRRADRRRPRRHRAATSSPPSTSAATPARSYFQADLTDAGDAFAVVRGHDVVDPLRGAPGADAQRAAQGLPQQPDGDVQRGSRRACASASDRLVNVSSETVAGMALRRARRSTPPTRRSTRSSDPAAGPVRAGQARSASS